MSIPAEDGSNLYHDGQKLNNGLEPNSVPSENPVERWANSRMELVPYKANSWGISGSRFSYEYPSGIRLLIEFDGKPEQVMDTCEAPWAVATVDAVFRAEGIRRLRPAYKIKVLERGAGLNIAGSRIIQRMIGRGSGEYHIIELNHDVAERTRQWAAQQTARLDELASGHGWKPDIQIYVHEGEAKQVTQELYNGNRTGKREKFNIIISDTFPLTPDEKGLNDIADLDVLKKLLYGGDEGVFSYFAYYPGWNKDKGKIGSIRAQQHSLLERHFRSIVFDDVNVLPAKGYDYLFENGTPVRRLPYVICTNKR